MRDFDELKTEDLDLLVRYEKQLKILEDIRAIFGAAGIEFVALKGAVIRNLYDEPWQRRSADVDILIKRERLSDAKAVLVGDGYKPVSINSQHMVFYSPSNVMLEVHFTLGDYKRLPKGAEVLEDVWSEGTRPSDYKSEKFLTDEYFYFYHIYHIAKHLISGGVKRRDIYDTYLLNTKVEFDQEKRDELLERGGLRKLDQELRALASNANANSMLQYYIDHPELMFAANLAFEGKNGKFKYLMMKVFPPVSLQKNAYPYLKDKPYLLPVSWMQRGYNLLANGYAKKMKNTVAGANAAKKEDIEFLQKLFEDLELM